MIEALSALDKKLFLEMNSWHATWLNPIMGFFSGQLIWLPFIILILYFAYQQLEKANFYLFLLFLVLVIVASDITSSYLLKNIVERMRPCRLPEIKAAMNHFGQKCGGRFGFVSSHAANSFAILAFAFFILNFKSRKFHLLWLLPLIVSFSRIYLGVHYPGDIVGGMVVGIGWGLILGMFFKNQRSWSKTA